MSILDDFSSTTTGAVWEPKQTGKKKDNNLVALTPGDDSILVGWFMGSEHDLGPKKDSTLHKIKIKTVGNEDHIQGELTNDVVGIWGTGVLNNKIVDSSIQIGQCVAIKWLGKVAPKSGGNPYHTWDLLVPNDLTKYPPLGMNEMPSVSATSEPSMSEAAQQGQKDNVVPVGDVLSSDDDDLPF